MAEELLMKAGLYVDAYNKMRLLQPDSADVSTELANETKEIIEKLNAFSGNTETVIKAYVELAMTVESEKIRAMSSRNALKTADKQRIADVQQLQILIRERGVELERLRVELEAAQRQENKQKEYLQKFLSS